MSTWRSSAELIALWLSVTVLLVGVILDRLQNVARLFNVNKRLVVDRFGIFMLSKDDAFQQDQRPRLVTVLIIGHEHSQKRFGADGGIRTLTPY